LLQGPRPTQGCRADYDYDDDDNDDDDGDDDDDDYGKRYASIIAKKTDWVTETKLL
jgi:hypothetical protein